MTKNRTNMYRSSASDRSEDRWSKSRARCTAAQSSASWPSAPQPGYPRSPSSHIAAEKRASSSALALGVTPCAWSTRAIVSADDTSVVVESSEQRSLNACTRESGGAGVGHFATIAIDAHLQLLPRNVLKKSCDCTVRQGVCDLELDLEAHVCSFAARPELPRTLEPGEDARIECARREALGPLQVDLTRVTLRKRLRGIHRSARAQRAIPNVARARVRTTLKPTAIAAVIRLPSAERWRIAESVQYGRKCL